MSFVNKKEKGLHRPTWIYSKDNGAGQFSQLEMLESARNVLEEIRNSQVLRCSVASAIKASADELRRCRIALEKIARRKGARRKQ